MNRRRFMNYLGAGSAASIASSTRANEWLRLDGPRLANAVGSPQPLPATGGGQVRRISLADYKDRVYGSWLGGIVGTVFGFPFEGEPKNVVEHLDRYLFRPTGAPYDWNYAPVDDDYYYEMVALYGFERHGVEMTVEQLGEMWKEFQAGTWGSSEQARLLLEKGIQAPHTGEPRYNRWFHTVGAQFSSDLFGMITPGMINLAAATARNYSHVNGYAEGSDGAVFVVGCISEAFFETDIEKIVRRAASLISPQSNYRRGLNQVLAGFERQVDWRKLADEIEDRWRPDYPQLNNSVSNGALVALGLLYGKGDYLASLNIVTSTGDYTDADCNADNVGSVLGALHGVKAIPSAMAATLHDRIYGDSMGSVKYRKVVDERISDLAERIAAVGKKLVIARGAVEKNGFLLIPHEEPREQELEWFDINDYGKLWNADWTLAHAGRGGTGDDATYLQWEDNTLVTFPRDARPCRLERQALLPGGRPELALTVGCVSSRPWRLQARVNDEILVHKVISTDIAGADPQFREFHLDLAKYAGQTVNLRLYHWFADGKPPARAYWRKAEIREA